MVGTTPNVRERARRRIARRLLPFLFVLYVIAYIDRVNVSYAALEMTRDLRFSDAVFGFGAGIFFVGYFLLEIPGTLLVELWSARKWIARIMISWGILTILIAQIHTAREFYILRFLLGAAEAGFFPGIIVYFTHWFCQEDRGKAVAMFMAAIPIANIIGSPLAGVLLGMHWLGVEGWRWLFVVEGIPAVAFGVVALFYLTDWPQEARWLPANERDWITGELEKEKAAKKRLRPLTSWQALARPEVLVLTLSYFLALLGAYGYSTWLPTILKRASGLPNLTVTLLAALPSVAALGAILWTGWHSDRTQERHWHTAVPLATAAIFLALASILGSSFWLGLAAYVVVGAGVIAWFPSFWALPTALLSEAAAATSIGLINSIGNLGGFAGPYLMGYLTTRTHSFRFGLICLLSALFLSSGLILSLRPRAPRTPA